MIEADDGRIVEVFSFKLRTLLAFLLLHENEVATRDALIEAIWNGSPPRSANHGLDVLISRLRGLLRDASEQPRLRTMPGGYVLEVRPAELDVDRFETHVRAGREALREGRSAEGVELLRRALGEWHGEALGDLAYEPFAEARTAQLEELRIDAAEDMLDAELRLGRHLEALPTLESLVARNPLHERARALLMRALYRAGRHADALECFRVGRRLLADQLGLEPSEDLRRLEAEILRQDTALGRSDFGHSLPAGAPSGGVAITYTTECQVPFEIVFPRASSRSTLTIAAPEGSALSASTTES